MIRVPTAAYDALAWHRAALAGRNPPRVEDEPQPGFYRRRYVKGGPWVPVLIWIASVTDPETGELTEPERMLAESLGQRVDLMKAWTSCIPISSDEYRALVKAHQDQAQMQATHAPLDLTVPTRPRRRA